MLPSHSIRFWVFLSKIVIYYFWLFQLFLVFSKSLYYELSGYVSNISIVCHTLLQEVQEHSLFCSFSWKFRFLLLAQVEIITNHILQFWTKIPKNGYCELSEKRLGRAQKWHDTAPAPYWQDKKTRQIRSFSDSCWWKVPLRIFLFFCFFWNRASKVDFSDLVKNVQIWPCFCVHQKIIILRILGAGKG